jgi:arylsulfatase A-like enzyme
MSGPLPPLVLALLLVAVPGCRKPPAAGAPLRHLVEPPGAMVALGNETRATTGPGTTVLARGWYPDAAALPGELPVPPSLARAEWLLLHYRVWEQPQAGAPARRAAPASASELRRVRRVGVSPVVVPEKLRELAASTGVRIEVLALPVEPGPAVLRFEINVPEHAELGFGYGLRPEAPSAQAAPVRFAVRALGAAGARHTLFDTTLDPTNAEARRWFDGTLDLRRFARRRVTLELGVEPVAPGEFALGLWSDPVMYTPPGESPRPNLVLVSLDTLRAASLGCYGHGRDTSPFLDRIAREGTLFENAIAPATVTGPSHMSLFTGVYPPRHGMLTGLEPKALGVDTLAARLRAAGYHTAAFTEDGYIIADLGFAEGFSTYTENTGQGGLSRPAEGEVRLTFGQAEKWLRENRRLPFFLFVHTYEVHFPYNPPQGYRTLFENDDLPGQPERPMLRRWFTDYDREVRFLDDELRRLFAAIGERGLAGSTVVVVFSDHGEEFGEHGGWQHGSTVFEELLRVPLIFWGPGRIVAGRRHSTQVSLIDVAPTLLDLAGLPVPATMQGTSLGPAVVEGREPPARPLFAETRARLRWLTSSVEAQQPPFIAVRRGTTKYIANRPASGEPKPTVAYDLAADPGESAPRLLSAEERALVDRLVNEYLAAGAAARPRPEPGAEASEIAPDVRERLRQLGYVE